MYSQGTLKEKTVENLEKFVVKDVSSLYSMKVQGKLTHMHARTHTRWVLRLLEASVFHFFVPTRGSCLSSSVG